MTPPPAQLAIAHWTEHLGVHEEARRGWTFRS